jgi:hypothetical protein
MNELPQPLPVLPDDMLPPPEKPPGFRRSMLPEPWDEKVRFLKPRAAEAVSAALDRCALEPDCRAIEVGDPDFFSRTGAYKLTRRQGSHRSWIGIGQMLHAEVSATGSDEDIVLSLDRAVALVVPWEVLLGDPRPLLDVSVSTEVVYGYPQDGRWLLEATHHGELRLFIRSPGHPARLPGK